MQCQAIKTAVCLWVLTGLIYSKTSWAENWKLEKQQGNVSIYSQDRDSGYKEIQVKTIVAAHPSALIALLDDVAFSSKWMHNCIEVKVLEEISATERIINSFFNAPWPVKNRDMVVLSETFMDGDSIKIKLSDQGSALPHHAKYVRMENMHGLWEAHKLENGSSEIIYTGGGNPGGNLPTFLANKELISSMFKTFQNLNRVILLDKYQTNDRTD
ncbi:START domain-containing protein [uncultured Paraglaciecola sp.]|uniref:START domain-containing protein n=1 Tax=uncultured Paraglaciecola sp. TaxID=1765024 RepID=UPI002633701F|nr:START domain-containing protein [uncultured Paraglaciecola sp.]